MKAVLVETVRIANAAEIARAEKITRWHLWKVANGKRKSVRLERILKDKYGITVKPMMAN